MPNGSQLKKKIVSVPPVILYETVDQFNQKKFSKIGCKREII